MADNDRRFARSASTQESMRSAQHRAVTQRGGITSPSATSSSSDDNGGASLGARLASISLDDMSTKAKNSATYIPKARKENVSTSHKFQHGVDPEDGDVFGETTTATSSGIPSAYPQTHVPTQNRGGNVDDGSEFSEYSATRSRDAHANSRYASDFTTPGRQTGSSSMVMYPRSSGTPGNRYQVDAQSFYPPGACVFVANLPEGVDDKRLEAEVTRHFMRFGTVFAKIRRDSRNMPFAFCQFTKEEDAQLGLIEGRGILIHGRACRTEMVRANRTYIIHRFNGDDLEVDEARFALEDAGLGEINRCFALPDDAQQALGMNKAVMFELKRFDPAKEVQAAFRHHPRYRVMAYDPKKASQASNVEADEAWLQRYDTDRRSIYMGDLPTNIDSDSMEASIRRVVDEIGDVAEVQVVRKATKVGLPPSVFAFVEFSRPDMADLAVERLNNRLIFGRMVRVERKAHRDAAILRNSRRMMLEQGSRETYRSPLAGSRHSGYGNNMPETPLRSRGYQPQHRLGVDSPAMSSPGPSFSATPSHMQWSSGFRPLDMNSPVNYTTSPYAGGYAAGTPQTHSAMATMTSPFYYPPPHMAWTQSPYAQQPEYSSYYTPSYVNTPARDEKKTNTSGRRGRTSSGEDSEKDSSAGNAGGNAA